MTPGDLEPLIPAAVYEAGERAAMLYMSGDDVFDVASDILCATIPLDRVCELSRMVTELEAIQREMRETDASPARSSGLGEGIQHLRARAHFLGRFL